MTACGREIGMKRYLLTVAYDGTAYAGFQVQKEARTIEGELNRVLTELMGQKIRVIGASRTDAGVHALGQVAHFDVNAAIPAKNYMTGVNHFLPPDIRILKAEETTGDFHARFSAHEKTYMYCIYESRFDRACYLNRAARVEQKLDL